MPLENAPMANIIGRQFFEPSRQFLALDDEAKIRENFIMNDQGRA